MNDRPPPIITLIIPFGFAALFVLALAVGVWAPKNEWIDPAYRPVAVKATGTTVQP